MPRRNSSFLLFLVLTLVACSFAGDTPRADQVQAAPSPIRSIEPPSPGANAETLEQKGDSLRAEKMFLDAIDYYRAALEKKPNSAALYNKIGIAQLQTQRWAEAKKSFERAIHEDRQFPEAYNNLGVVYYVAKKYNKAIERYTKAIHYRDDTASYYSNLGAALFSKKEYDKSLTAYSHAFQLDPDVFERTSRSGVNAQMSKPDDRAHFDYVVAKLYAKMGSTERSLEYLRRAMEEGYKNINSVYKDEEFAGLRKDHRFTELMAAKPPAITD
jgi:tetratricopeptide (TPR) repeat protein